MTFSDLAIYLQKLENTTSRNTMVEVLASLFEETKVADIDKVVYLLQGRVAPLYINLEMGMADRMMFRAIAQAYNVETSSIEAAYKQVGDLGKVSGEYAGKMRGKARSSLTVEQVFSVLKDVAQTTGEGSVEKKITLMADLLSELNGLSAYFVSRIPVGKLRLGFSDMTVLDALSWMVAKNKSHRAELERAFNVHPDLGLLAQKVKEKGIEGLKAVKPEVGTPILMARAERLSSADEIIEKIGKCAIEYKYDGLRIQVHYDGKDVKIFTRNLEDATYMYPDVIEAVKTQIDKSVILEGEAIAVNIDTGEFLPFQETTKRKRKHDIDSFAKEIPLKLIAFELLYYDGESYLDKSYEVRRKTLSDAIKKGTVIELSEAKVVNDPKEVELLFDDAISRGLEGILAKRLEGVYQAGARGWNWIKFKRSYAASLDDTIDCVVMGYNLGEGKRTDFGIGAFLIGVYDEKQDKFVTVGKIGTGLTDDEWRELRVRCDRLKSKVKPPLYDVSKMLEPDVWVEPEIIVEIRADEITRSTVHTAGRVMKPSKSGDALAVDVPGYALRFPRLERFRDDRKIEDATTLNEIEKMFEKQKVHKKSSQSE